MNDEIKKLVEQIVAAVPEKLTDEQIKAISSKCALLTCRPEIRITSDPQEFATVATEKRTVYDDRWVGRDVSSTILSTLYGDYEQSDFSVNKMQIALLDDINDDYTAQLIIYVPKKREYDITSYRDFIKNELRKTLCNDINNAAKGKLTILEIKKFLEQYDFSKGLPEIVTTSDPQEFDSNAKERHLDLVNTSLEIEDESQTSTTTLYGDYKPGMEDIYEYAETKSSPSEEITVSDFSLSKVQVALVSKTSFKSLHGKEDREDSTTLVIYLPDEKEYDVDSFKQLTEKKHAPSEVEAIMPNRRMGNIHSIMGLYIPRSNQNREDEQK